MPDVDPHVDDEDQSGVEVPPAEGHGKGHPCGFASAPVHDPRYEDVQGEEEQQEVRDRKADPPFDERPGLHELLSHASEGPAALGQVHDHQPDEDKADNSVIGDPHVEQLQRGESSRGGAQQSEVDREPGSGAPRGPVVRSRFWLKRRIKHLAPNR